MVFGGIFGGIWAILGMFGYLKVEQAATPWQNFSRLNQQTAGYFWLSCLFFLEYSGPSLVIFYFWLFGGIFGGIWAILGMFGYLKVEQAATTW